VEGADRLLRALLQRGQKGVGEEGPGDGKDPSEMAVCKAIEEESAQHMVWQEKFSARMPDHKQVGLSVLQTVWAHAATSIHVTGHPQLPHPESLLGVEGYARKYKSRGS